MQARKNYKTVFIILGPTAAGKTAAAIRLAQSLNTAIISADSRQCYKELDIGVARPSPGELHAVKHHFIASHSILQDVNAAIFEEYAMARTEEIFQAHDAAVMVGGTGLYINAFCEGLDAIPAVNPLVRNQVQTQYKKAGMEWLRQEVREQDPDFFAVGETLNPQRLIRALEVKLSTGYSILSFRKQQKKQRPFRISKIGLNLPKETLHEHIHRRVDQMMATGLLDEVRGLLPYKDLPALRTVGYTELFDHLAGRLSLDEAVAAIKTNTRHYAKRQLTWFRKDPSIRWIGPGDWEALREAAREAGFGDGLC